LYRSRAGGAVRRHPQHDLDGEEDEDDLVDDAEQGRLGLAGGPVREERDIGGEQDQRGDDHHPHGALDPAVRGVGRPVEGAVQLVEQAQRGSRAERGV